MTMPMPNDQSKLVDQLIDIRKKTNKLKDEASKLRAEIKELENKEDKTFQLIEEGKK